MAKQVSTKSTTKKQIDKTTPKKEIKTRAPKTITPGKKDGRPPIFESQEELNNKIEQYFEYIQGEYEIVDFVDMMGEPAKKKVYSRDAEPATITGIALFLGYESRQSLYDNEKNSNFSYPIKRGKLKVEHEYEKALFSKNSTGAIFGLKNFGWTDKQTIEQIGETTKQTIIINGKEVEF